MAKSVKFAGSFRVYDSDAGASKENEPIDESIDVTEKVAHTYVIAASQTDVPIPLGGVSPAKKVYLNPNGVSCTLKINDTGETGFTINSVTILGGSITGLYISTTGEVTLDVIAGG